MILGIVFIIVFLFTPKSRATLIASPKLFINAEPGSILVGKTRERCRNWKNQKEVTVQGGHFIQEISPNEIGSAIRSFLSDLE